LLFFIGPERLYVGLKTKSHYQSLFILNDVGIITVKVR
jgi:hypothetical protein